MRSLLDFDDTGADDDEPVNGVTVGDIRAWHDSAAEMERSKLVEKTLVETMLQDLLNAVSHFYGQEGLEKVVDHMKLVNRSREHNAEIDALAAMIEDH